MIDFDKLDLDIADLGDGSWAIKCDGVPTAIVQGLNKEEALYNLIEGNIIEFKGE